MMKTKIVLISLTFLTVANGAFAKGKFQKSTPPPTPPPVAAYQPPLNPNCSGEFAKSSEYFKDLLGEEASIDNIKDFKRTIVVQGQNLTTHNRFLENGGQLYLRVKIPFFSDIDVPVQICKEDGKLTARLIMGAAMVKSSQGPALLKASFKSVPDEMALAISRTDNQIKFTDGSKPEEPATVAELNSNPVVVGAAK